MRPERSRPPLSRRELVFSRQTEFMAVVQKHWRASLERVEKYISDTYFIDVNLRGRLYPKKLSIPTIRWYNAGQQQVSYSTACQALDSVAEVAIKNVSIGPTWSTHWFLVEVTIPDEWAGQEVCLRWDSGGEAMVWIEGEPQQGLTGSHNRHQIRTDFTLTKNATASEKFHVYIEAVASDMFGAGANGMINPPDPSRYYSISVAELTVFDGEVYGLLRDLTTIYDMAKHLPEGSERAYQALYTANEIVNICDPFNKSTFSRCRAVAEEFLSERNGQAQHTIHAMGHCHIDSAWLWPYSETVRKCARSWSSVLRLMDQHPSFTFVCSQAQQLEWVKSTYPGLYERIQAKAKTRQFIPAGGTWIEMDGNIPSGESFVRQFLLGQMFFKEEFGHYCKEFWLPDTFGYSAQLPQIMAGSGIDCFLSQKLSWNLTNKFPHHTFLWEGIDGTCSLAHFPPADTYESCADVKDVIKTVTQFRDKGRSRHSILLYGHGDGGGGPTEDMLQSLERIKDVYGVPKVIMSSPDQFFSAVKDKDGRKNLCKWVGELYLELHRGTYTTQAEIKKENRKIEFLLHDVDFMCGIDFILNQDIESAKSTRDRLLPLWKKFLLNQFHDVLPGSCIQQVVKDALAYYEEVKDGANAVLKAKLNSIINKQWKEESEGQLNYVAVNTFGWKRREVVRLPSSDQEPFAKRAKLDSSADNGDLAMVECVPFGMQVVQRCQPQGPVSVKRLDNGDILMKNIYLRAVLHNGVLTSLMRRICTIQRECILPGSGGSQFVIFDDVPLFWDAWDVMEYHQETRKPLGVSQDSVCVLADGPLRAIVQVKIPISSQSQIVQQIILDADSLYLRFDTTVEWHESHKFLKVEFPLNVRSHEATYEIQFGHLKRPTHFNTTWDQARFEVCAQKWAALSEHDFGVAILNNCKYGYSTLGNIMRLSLLRSPKAPDANADMDTHHFTYAIMPHEGTFQNGGVIRCSYDLNNPLFITRSTHSGEPVSFFTFDGDGPEIILETVKMVEKLDSKAIVLRMYEACGSRTPTTLRTQLPVKSYQRCNLLEDPTGPLETWTGKLSIDFEPFKIVSYLLYF